MTLAALFTSGCHLGQSAPFESYGQRAQLLATPLAPVQPGAPDTFAVLVKAAQEAEIKAPNATKNTTFAPATQKLLKLNLADAVTSVRVQASLPVNFQFKAREPFETPPNQKGWRILGRIMVWTEQSAAAMKDYNKAIGCAVDATGFGFGLTSGGATDAALGLTIADESRRAIANSLEDMTPEQLDALATGYERALASKPTLQAAIKHEHQNMLMAVQYVQDCYARNDFKVLKDTLGSDIREAITYLEDMKPDDNNKRPAYFEGFYNEAEQESSYLDKACLLPARKRQEPTLAEGKRPWRRFSQRFFQTGRPLMAMNDATLARTRMLVITARLLAMEKRNQPIPAELNKFDARLRQDPFSGYPFVYHAQGSHFRLYSVGSDFKDDGGETDAETFMSPDLALERNSD